MSNALEEIKEYLAKIELEEDGTGNGTGNRTGDGTKKGKGYDNKESGGSNCEQIVEAVIFSKGGWGFHKFPDDLGAGQPMTWKQAAPFLEKMSIKGGYGAPVCCPMRIYTPSHIIFVSEYDGSTRLNDIPRHPVKGETDFYYG